MVKGIKPTDKLYFEVRMSQIDRNQEKLDTLQAEIAEKYNVPIQNVVVDFKPVLLLENGKQKCLASDFIDNIQDSQFFLALCADYIQAKGITDVDFENIKKINENVEQYIDTDQYAKNKKYRFKYVKWSNYLSYGPDNYFNFTNLHGLVLLNSQPGNQGGKTTFAISLLRFALFGKSPKTPNLNDVFNIYLHETTEVVVEACLEIDGVDYVIRRTVTRPALKKRTDKSKPKQTVEYYKVVGDGEYEEIENCEGENTQQTNNIIKETIGNAEDFDLVISATKKTVDDLFEKGKTEQGRLFSRWLGLISIEQREEIAKDLWKKNIFPSLKSNTYNRGILEVEIQDYKTCNKTNEEAIETENKKVSETAVKIKQLDEDKTNILKNRKAIREELEKIDITTVENNIASKNNDLELKRSVFAQRKEEYLQVKDAVFNEESYKAKTKELENLTNSKHQLELSNSELRVKISTINDDIRKIQQLISEGVCPNCKQKIDVSTQTDFIKEHEANRKELIDNGVANKQKIEEIDGKMANVKEEISKMEEERDKVNQMNRLKPTLTAIKTNIDMLKMEIEKLEQQRKDIDTNKDNIRYNNEIDTKIRNIEVSINEYTKIKEQHIRNIESYNADIKHNNKCIKEREDLIEILKEEEKTIRDWTIYQELVGKNGVIKIVLKRALPIINNEIKRTLDGICDFDIILEVNEKNEVEINMVNDGAKRPIEISGSGFETTFAALAVRNALATISSFAKPNFLVLDECTSTVNPENYDVLNELYHRILSNYDYIIDICHTSELDDIHDMVVTVVKDGHISKVEM